MAGQQQATVKMPEKRDIRVDFSREEVRDLHDALLAWLGSVSGRRAERVKMLIMRLSIAERLAKKEAGL